jgi:signal recognition particle receptor subunit beta
MGNTPLDRHVERAAHVLADLMRRAGLTPPPEPLLVPALLVTLITLLIGASFLSTFAFAPSRNARDTVLIVGASPSSTLAPAPGKTTLFHALRTGRAPPYGTVPSQVPNEAVFAAKAACATDSNGSPAELFAPVKWVDFPGHARLRPQLAAYLISARIVVIAVDSSSAVFARTVRESADLLHEVLTHATVAKHVAPVLVFCNKADTLGAASPATVRTRLEAELERVRKAKSVVLAGAQNAAIAGSGMSVSADSGGGQAFLGYENEVFNFDHVPNVVQFASGSAKMLDASCVASFVAEHF